MRSRKNPNHWSAHPQHRANNGDIPHSWDKPKPKRDLNDITRREDVMFTVELGARAYVGLATENDENGPIGPYIQGMTEYLNRIEGNEEGIRISEWITKAWDREPMSISLQQALSIMATTIAETRGITRLEAVDWMEDVWQHQEPYDEAYEDRVAAYYWEEWITNGGMDDD